MLSETLHSSFFAWKRLRRCLLRTNPRLLCISCSVACLVLMVISGRHAIKTRDSSSSSRKLLPLPASESGDRGLPVHLRSTPLTRSLRGNAQNHKTELKLDVSDSPTCRPIFQMEYWRNSSYLVFDQKSETYRPYQWKRNDTDSKPALPELQTLPIRDVTSAKSQSYILQAMRQHPQVEYSTSSSLFRIKGIQCLIKHFSRHEASACLRQRDQTHVVFMGDSRIRNRIIAMLNWTAEFHYQIQLDSYPGTPQTLAQIQDKALHSSFTASPSIPGIDVEFRFVWNQFLEDPWDNLIANVQNRTSFVVIGGGAWFYLRFLQTPEWPAEWAAAKSKFREALWNLKTALHKMWTVHPHIPVFFALQDPTKDWRARFVQQGNRLSQEVLGDTPVILWNSNWLIAWKYLSLCQENQWQGVDWRCFSHDPHLGAIADQSISLLLFSLLCSTEAPKFCSCHKNSV